jgi:hypothetical protein
MTGQGMRAGMQASFATLLAQAAAAGDLDAVHVAHHAITRLLASPGVATPRAASVVGAAPNPLDLATVKRNGG